MCVMVQCWTVGVWRCLGTSPLRTNLYALPPLISGRKAYPPAQNRYMQEKNLEELILARIHVGPVFALVRIQDNIFEELFLKYVFALWPCPLYLYSACIRTSLVPIHENIFGELISVQIHAAHVFTPGRIQENIPGELFMYWFRARGYSVGRMCVCVRF